MANPDVIVVGAGVAGLTTGVVLAEQGLRVRLRSLTLPGATTSAVASAMVGPVFGPPRSETDRQERASIADFTRLAAIPGTGVSVRRGRLASRVAEPVPAGAEACGPADLPPGFTGGYWASVPLVDMPRYLSYLVDRLYAAGGTIVLGRLRSLTAVAAEAPLLVNCAGLGARNLVGDRSLYAVRGQHVIVENPGIDEFFVEEPWQPAWAAYWPYEDHVVLGGVAADGDEDLAPRPDIAGGIVGRCAEIEPRLRDAKVIGHQVGLRPFRPSVRLEAEQVDGTRCVHNYGHGSRGISLSWGCARAAAALLTA